MRVHDVFHINLLEPHKADFLGREPTPLPPVVTEQGEEEWEIEQILQSERKTDGSLKYFVTWKGYGEEHNSWVAEDETTNMKELVDDFHELHPHAPKPTQFVTTKRGQKAKKTIR